MNSNATLPITAVIDCGTHFNIATKIDGLASFNLPVPKIDGLNIRLTDKVRFDFNMLTGELNKDTGVTLIRDDKPFAQLAYAR